MKQAHDIEGDLYSREGMDSDFFYTCSDCQSGNLN
jgi:hypothetical protein